MTTNLPVLPNPDFTIRMNSGPPNTFAILVLGVVQTSLALDPFGMTGCTKLSGTELELMAAISNTAGTAEVTIELAAIVTANGFVFTSQWAALDAPANPAELVFSDA